MDRTALTDKNVQEIIGTAEYGGITYWAVDTPEDERAAIFEEFPDAVMVFREDETGEDYHLTIEDIRNAYFDMLSLDQRFVNREIHGYIIDSYRHRDEDGVDTGFIDAWAADAIVQIATFGELVYG